MSRLCLFAIAVGFIYLSGPVDAQSSPQQRLRRSGRPTLVAPWARGTFAGHYEGGMIGGGAARGGLEAGVLDGTWGWDFGGTFGKRIWLGWSNGKRSQGGTGAYGTEGPRIRRRHHSASGHSDGDHPGSGHE